MRHGEKRCAAAGPPARSAARRRASGENRRSRAASSPSAPSVAPGGQPCRGTEAKPPVPDGARPRRNRRRHGGSLAHDQQSGPSRPAGNSRTPASVAGRGAAARAATDRVAGGNGAPAIVCSSAASAARLRAAAPISTAKPSGRSTACSARPARRSAGPARRAVGRRRAAAATRAAVAGPSPSRSRRSRRRRGRSAVAIGVRRVLDPCHAGGDQRRAQPRRRHRQQRAQHTQPRRLHQRRHAGQTGRAAAAERADQQRLGLIAGVVPEQQVQDARLGAGSLQRREPCRRAPAPQAPDRGQARDRQHLRRDAARAKPRRRCRRLRCPTPRADHDRRPAPAAIRRAPRPGVGQQRQGHAVGAARDAGRDPRRRLERPERAPSRPRTPP